MKKIGLCGTGKMGKAIGARLIEKKYNLSIWNRTKSNSEDLIKSGGKFFEKVLKFSENFTTPMDILYFGLSILSICVGYYLINRK